VEVRSVAQLKDKGMVNGGWIACRFSRSLPTSATSYAGWHHVMAITEWANWIARHGQACGALIACAPFDHGGNPRADIAFEYRRMMDQAS
jgi:hypothetical protein